MYMNSASYLRSEDRPDFVRVLDEVLRSGGTRPTPSGGGHPLHTEQLRTMALREMEHIAARASPEYQEYLKVREQARADDRAGSAEGLNGLGEPDNLGNGAGNTANVPVTDPPASGAGLLAVVAVLTPMLAGTAAVIFLLMGYALEALRPESTIAQPLRTAGWLFAAVAVGGMLIGMVWLLLTALRNSSAAPHGSSEELPPEVASARAAWQRALLERGLQPFLQEATAKAADPPRVPYDGHSADGPRMPRLGYSRPDFTSPGPEESPGPGRRFSSPDFGGPDNKPN
jgi:hypothetical protein